MAKYSSGIHVILLKSKEKHLRVIGENILKHLRHVDAEWTFMTESSKQNLAFITNGKCLNRFAGKFFISEDRFSETLNGMMVRKGFCCKNVLETFVHRMMSSGILNMYNSHTNFMYALPLLLWYPENNDARRKLTLIDVPLAFL